MAGIAAYSPPPTRLTRQSITPRGGVALRAAAVQLTATADTARNLETADRLVREAAARGAELVVLPEKWAVLGRGEDLRAGAQPLDGPALIVGARRPRASSASTSSPARSPSATEGEREAAQHLRARRPRRRDRATYRKIHLFDVEVDGRVYRESDHEEPGDEPVLTETAGRRRASAWASATTCASPSSTACSRSRGARILTVPGGLHRADHARPLGGAAARPRDREPVLRDRRQPDRRARARPARPAGAR